MTTFLEPRLRGISGTHRKTARAPAAYLACGEDASAIGGDHSDFE